MNAAVCQVISRCVFKPCEQKMADLPRDRISPAPPFTYTGVDYFGLFLIKGGRKKLKRYCALFTCLVSRAVHIKVASTLESSSFIQALRRFLARHDPVREIRSDSGTCKLRWHTKGVASSHRRKGSPRDSSQTSVRKHRFGHQKNDVYMCRRWRRMQYLANLFWSRWKKEYLVLMQERSKWQHPQRNLVEGNIVMLRDENTPRNVWSFVLVEQAE